MSMLRNDPEWTDDKLESLAWDIYNFLLERGMWQDVIIYFNGKALSTHKIEGGKDVFAYNEKPFILMNEDPRDYFEYVNPCHILSMSFEGPFYKVMNGCLLGDFHTRSEFSNLLESRGLYYECGNAWNLSLYKI